MAYINLNEFLDNLVVTQKYCAQQLSRSLQLTLQYEPSDPEQFTNRQKYEIAVRRHYTKAILRSTNQGDNMKIVDLGYIALSQLFPVQLKLKKKQFGAVREKMYAGQVLACEYEKIFMDVSAPTKSGGFMDAHNLPPIDTWFYCTRKENTPMLFAWIPEPFVAAVQNVIDQSDFHDLSWFSNPENNISDFY